MRAVPKFISRLGTEGRVDYAFDATGTDTQQLYAQYNLHVIDSTLGNGSAYLPPVAEMAGRIITVINLSANTTTLYPFNDGAGNDDSVIYNGAAAATSQALAAAQAFTILFSTGLAWYAIHFDLTI